MNDHTRNVVIKRAWCASAPSELESKRRIAADQFAEMLPPGERIEVMVGGSLRSTCVSLWSNNDRVVAM
jgi:hypothetical protein